MKAKFYFMKAKKLLEEYKERFVMRDSKKYDYPKSVKSEGPISLNTSLVESNTLSSNDVETDEYKRLMSITLNNIA